MRFAVPVEGGRLSAHFGHARAFAIVDVEPGTGQIIKRETADAPQHEHGLLPRWLHELGVNVVIAGGMGMSAQQLLQERGIEVVLGADGRDAESLVRAYLDKTLVTGGNTCDH